MCPATTPIVLLALLLALTSVATAFIPPHRGNHFAARSYRTFNWPDGKGPDGGNIESGAPDDDAIKAPKGEDVAEKQADMKFQYGNKTLGLQDYIAAIVGSNIQTLTETVEAQNVRIAAQDERISTQDDLIKTLRSDVDVVVTSHHRITTQYWKVARYATLEHICNIYTKQLNIKDYPGAKLGYHAKASMIRAWEIIHDQLRSEKVDKNKVHLFSDEELRQISNTGNLSKLYEWKLKLFLTIGAAISDFIIIYDETHPEPHEMGIDFLTTWKRERNNAAHGRISMETINQDATVYIAAMREVNQQEKNHIDKIESPEGRSEFGSVEEAVHQHRTNLCILSEENDSLNSEGNAGEITTCFPAKEFYIAEWKKVKSKAKAKANRLEQ